MSAAGEVVKLKLCMAGEAAVGKTSLIRRYVLDEYDDRYVATLGTKITKKSLTVPRPGGGGRVSVDVILWDIMGTPMLRELLKEAYYHGANGILAVADLTRHHTLAALDEWSRSIRSVAGDIPTYGVVNKEDLHPEREITSAEVESFFRDRAWSWSYASAKTGSGVEKSFQDLVGDVLARRA
ncbi:MAG TPA: Rab family GTPase [Thermoplasmata archaeon]|nr:Rab family GTPase [Thermoplasmata archaeon]